MVVVIHEGERCFVKEDYWGEVWHDRERIVRESCGFSPRERVGG